MSIKDTINDLISQFGRQLGIEELALDDNGFCALEFDRAIPLQLQIHPDQERLIVFAEVGFLPEEPAIETTLNLLRANYFWQGTGGGTLSIGEEGAVVLLREVRVEGITYAAFEKLLGTFLDVAEFWQKQLQSSPATEVTLPEVGEAAFLRV